MVMVNNEGNDGGPHEAVSESGLMGLYEFYKYKIYSIYNIVL